jgi:undecaprenyl-diphosphatase
MRAALPLWQRVHAFDADLLVRVQAIRHPWTTRLMLGLTRLGDAETWVGMGLLLAAAPGGQNAAKHLGVAALGATGLVQILKRSFRRSRPDHTIAGFRALAENPDRFSFPSGHTATAVSVAIGAGAHLGAALSVLAAGVAVSRLYLGAHYPLDLAAGALVGTIAGLGTRILLG